MEDKFDHDQPQPIHVVTELPIKPEDAASYIRWVNRTFFNLDLDSMREMIRQHRRIPNKSKFDVVVFEPRVLDDPIDFGIDLTRRDFARVRIRPEDFDRTNEQQRRVFQNILSFIEVMGSIRVSKRNGRELGIDCIKFSAYQTAEQAQKWRTLLERWKAAAGE